MPRYNDQYSTSTPPGKSIVYFFTGIGLFALGAFLITRNTSLYYKFNLRSVFGFDPPFGLVLLPLLLGIGVLFFNGRSILGWCLSIFGILIILAGILMGLDISFRPVSLYEGILMFGLVAAGIGSTLRGVAGRRR